MSAALPLIEKAGMGAAKAGAGLLKGGAHAAADVLKTGAGGPEQLLQQFMAGQTGQFGAPTSAPACPTTPSQSIAARAPTVLPAGTATDAADPSFGYKPGSPMSFGGPAAIPASLLPAKSLDLSGPAPSAVDPTIGAQANTAPVGPDHHVPDRWLALISGGPRALLDEIDRQRLAEALRQGANRR